MLEQDVAGGPPPEKRGRVISANDKLLSSVDLTGSTKMKQILKISQMSIYCIIYEVSPIIFRPNINLVTCKSNIHVHTLQYNSI